LTPNELVLTFGGLHVCVQFGENRRKNATVRVSTDGQTHTRGHEQTQNDVIICPMLYAIDRDFCDDALYKSTFTITITIWGRQKGGCF